MGHTSKPTEHRANFIYQCIDWRLNRAVLVGPRPFLSDQDLL